MLVVQPPAIAQQNRPRERVLGLLTYRNDRIERDVMESCNAQLSGRRSYGVSNQYGLRQRGAHEAGLVLEGAAAGSVTALLVRVSEPVMATREGYPSLLLLLEGHAEARCRGGAGEADVEMREANKEQVPFTGILAEEGNARSVTQALLGENCLDTGSAGGFIAVLIYVVRHRGQGTGVNTGEEYAVSRHDVCLFERL